MHSSIHLFFVTSWLDIQINITDLVPAFIELEVRWRRQKINNCIKNRVIRNCDKCSEGNNQGDENIAVSLYLLNLIMEHSKHTEVERTV